MALNESKIKSGILLVIGILLIVIIGANILPIALDAWFNTSTTTWDSGTAALWDLVPLFAVIAIVLYFVASALDLI